MERRRVPDSVWDLTDLETLILADDGLVELPEQIARLKRPRTLDLGHNALSSTLAAMEPGRWWADLEARGCAVYR